MQDNHGATALHWAAAKLQELNEAYQSQTKPSEELQGLKQRKISQELRGRQLESSKKNYQEKYGKSFDSGVQDAEENEQREAYEQINRLQELSTNLFQTLKSSGCSPCCLQNRKAGNDPMQN